MFKILTAIFLGTVGFNALAELNLCEQQIVSVKESCVRMRTSDGGDVWPQQGQPNPSNNQNYQAYCERTQFDISIERCGSKEECDRFTTRQDNGLNFQYQGYEYQVVNNIRTLQVGEFGCSSKID